MSFSFPISPEDGQIHSTGEDINYVYRADIGSWELYTEKYGVVKAKFRYTTTEGQTVITGADTDGKILEYTVGYLTVIRNGITLVESLDYTATNGTSITLVVGADVDDIVVVEAHGSFTIADHYTKNEADDLLDLKADASDISNIDNTSDANKPVSTAQQNALDLVDTKNLQTIEANSTAYGYTKRVDKADRWLETDMPNVIVDIGLGSVRFSDGLIDLDTLAEDIV